MAKIRNYCFAAGMFLIMLLSACVSGTEETIVEPLSEGDRLPAFQIETEAGIVTAETLKGIPSVLVFFHTKCPDCQQELPYIQQLYDKYFGMQDAAADAPINLLLISYKETPKEIAAYWEEHGYTMPCLFFESPEMVLPFKITAVPTVYVCDKNGIIRHISKDNPIATFTQLDTWISELLAE